MTDDSETIAKGRHRWTPAAPGGAHPEGMFHGALSWTPTARGPFHFHKRSIQIKSSLQRTDTAVYFSFTNRSGFTTTSQMHN